MFTKEFIKISQILDNNGMHKQADDLLRIAQAKPATKPTAKPGAPAAKPGVKPGAKPATSPVQMITPSEQNKRIEYYNNNIKNITSLDSAKNLAQILDNQYKNNLLDYNSYVKLITNLKAQISSTGLGTLDVSPINPINPTAFPTNVNDKTMMGRGPLGLGNQIQLATPLEGVTAAGEKALLNREDRNLPGLVNEWNSYLKTNSFKDSIKARIDQLGGIDSAKKTNPDLVALYEKANKDEGLQVGDFGNKGKASEVYGVEAKPLTTITGTPTTPAPGTTTPATPPATSPVTPQGPTAPNRG